MCQSATRQMPRPCCCAANSLCRAERDQQVSQGGSIVLTVLIGSRALGNKCGERPGGPGQLARICAERAPPWLSAPGEVSGRALRRTIRRRRNNWPASAALPEDGGKRANGQGRTPTEGERFCRLPVRRAGSRVGSGGKTTESAATLPTTGRRTTRRVASTLAAA